MATVDHPEATNTALIKILLYNLVGYRYIMVEGIESESTANELSLSEKKRKSTPPNPIQSRDKNTRRLSPINRK